MAGMETAFRATLTGVRMPGRTTGFVCLYDAVAAVRPDGRTEAVHRAGTGRSPAALPARLALARSATSLPGSVVVIGCPADEIHAPGTIVRGGGKAISAEAGVWDDVDAALYAHPEFVDTVSRESRWLRRATAIVPGSRSLACRRRAAARGCRCRARGRARARPGQRHARAARVRRRRRGGDGPRDEGDLPSLRRRGAGGRGGPRGRAGALPDATWELGRLVRGGAPGRPCHGCRGGAFRTIGHDFVEPTRRGFPSRRTSATSRAAARLRSSASAGRGLGVSHGRGRGGVRFAGGRGAAMMIAQVLALAALELLISPTSPPEEPRQNALRSSRGRPRVSPAVAAPPDAPPRAVTPGRRRTGRSAPPRRCRPQGARTARPHPGARAP